MDGKQKLGCSQINRTTLARASRELSAIAGLLVGNAASIDHAYNMSLNTIRNFIRNSELTLFGILVTSCEVPTEKFVDDFVYSSSTDEGLRILAFAFYHFRILVRLLLDHVTYRRRPGLHA